MIGPSSWLNQAAFKWPKKEAIFDENIALSFEALHQDICFFSLFLSNHFKKISEEQGVQWGLVWDSEGITKLKLSRDPGCRVCGNI